MLVQLFERQGLVDRNGVPDDVKVGLFEIHDSLAILINNCGVMDVPFSRNHPIKTPCSAGNLVQGQIRKVSLDDGQGFPDAAASDASANGKQLCA